MNAPTLRAGHRLLALLSGIAFACLSHAGIPIAQWQHTSGAQVFLVESHAIPMLDLQIDWDAGTRRDPADKPQLSNLMASATAYGVKTDGKNPALDENGLSDAWADLGAYFSGNASADRLTFSLRSLSDPALLQKAVALAARQLAEPLFPEAAFLRDRRKLIAALKEANTRPAVVANRAFAQAVYGKHPYGYESTEASLLRIGIADIRALHPKALRACNAKISIVGDLNRQQADTLVNQLLERLSLGQAPGQKQARCEPTTTVPEVAALSKAHEERIAFSSAQAHVLLGQPGYQRNSPDYFAMLVGNHILGGGGFTSRLTEEIREKRGLTYGVYSNFSPGLHAGAFTIALQTRPDQAQQALELARKVLSQFVQDGPSEKELQAAKDNLIGGFALRLDSNRKLLDNVANIAWNNLPLNYLDTWSEQVQKLTPNDIHNAFRRIVQPANMATIVLGAP
jgi:zinc protease